MLRSLRVKNLALIQETEIQFGKGLNILTGETGAGKSLLIGSVNLALGGKFEKEMLRKGEETALVELTFDCDDRIAALLRRMDVEVLEDEGVIISRKMQVGKSTCKINGETVSAKQVRELSEALIDIHGQHEHQSLLQKKKHLEILDAFCGEKIEDISEKVKDLYHACKDLKKKIEEEQRDEQEISRERSLAEFELDEILKASVVIGEDEDLEKKYRLMVNSKKIKEGLLESYQYSGNDEGAGNAISRALKALRSVSSYDEKLEQLESLLLDVDSLLTDYNREVSGYLEDCEFDEEDFYNVEERLNLLNRLKGKYGKTLEEVCAYADEKQSLLDKLSDYDNYMESLQRDYVKAQEKLVDACKILTNIRREQAEVLSKTLQESLENLNFLTVDFAVEVRQNETITEKGADDVEFLISTNPGEERRALGQVASGGELSRIMLAIKTVLAGKDDIDTLIFDEIDTGISGKTAWQVSKQLSQVASKHQVICITHLSQIAAMSDRHFMIEKNLIEGNTVTDIRKLESEESLGELARLLGSDELTKAALDNAVELKNQALAYKKEQSE